LRNEGHRTSRKRTFYGKTVFVGNKNFTQVPPQAGPE
jgi:hypothetical protein